MAKTIRQPRSRSRPRYLVGVDLGGTKILAGVFNDGLALKGVAKLSTKAERGVEPVIERIARCIRDAADECDVEISQIAGIGLGAPGAVAATEGKVLFAPNLGWRDVLLADKLQQILGVPVWLENDCQIAMLGVYEVELKRKPKHVVGIFIGTGIGGSMVIHGQHYTGGFGTAGELGHMTLLPDGPKCGCGNRGCFEALCSRTALFREIRSAVRQGKRTVLTSTLGRGLKDMRSGDIRKAIRRGDTLVKRIVVNGAQYMGVAVANIINVVNPEVVVLGGGVVEALEHEIMPLVERSARARVLSGTATQVRIIASRLADHAGITGGAVLARNKRANVR